MNIEVSPKLEAQLRARAQAEGLSVAAYVERLMREEEERAARLADFRQAIDERVAALDRGEGVDGEEVMARLLPATGP